MDSIEAAVRADIAANVSRAPYGEALAALAYGLASIIDEIVGAADGPRAGLEQRSPAGLSKELRAVLGELGAASVGGDDDLAAALSRLTGPAVPGEMGDPS
jgi:hypothetical protein